jgi:hypothetical protein
MRYYLITIATMVLLLLFGCSKETATMNTSTSSSSSTSSQSTPVPRPTENPNSLTNAKVESAVTRTISDYRFNGSISVEGIQELPQQNSAVADLRFNGFEYPVTNEGRLMKTKDFHPKSYPENRKPTDQLPSMEQMLPPRKVSYSGSGRGVLTRYNDGRWVLKEVSWGQGFNSLGVTGTVSIN